MNEPTERQLKYLSDLGYRGIKPETIEEASIAIDVIKRGGSQSEAERGRSEKS